MGTNSTGCTEWERDFDPQTERPQVADLFQRPAYYDQIALEAARQINALPTDLHPSQLLARIQLIVLKAMCRASR